MAQGVHKVTENFEMELAKYTGSPFVVCVDNQSNALFLCLYYWIQKRKKEHKKDFNYIEIIDVPKRTYPSVPCFHNIKWARFQYLYVQKAQLQKNSRVQLNRQLTWTY